MRKAHSIHNEQLCDLLLKNGKFNDWVVTSAFYSAMHLIQHQIFPLTLGVKTYNTFSNYYSLEVKNKKPFRSKHDSNLDLARIHLNGCAANYGWLKDACFNARYNNYNVQPAVAQKAKDYLDKIKLVCVKP